MVRQSLIPNNSFRAISASNTCGEDGPELYCLLTGTPLAPGYPLKLNIKLVYQSSQTSRIISNHHSIDWLTIKRFNRIVPYIYLNDQLIVWMINWCSGLDYTYSRYPGKYIDGQYCNTCETGQHPIENTIDEDEDNWWQSSSLAIIPDYNQKMNIELFLGQVLFFKSLFCGLIFWKRELLPQNISESFHLRRS